MRCSAQIPASSPYFWSARLRAAVNLEMLDRTEEAITEMQAMAAQEPHRAAAELQLGESAAQQEALSRSRRGL